MTSDPTPREAVEVTQADREAAADLIEAYWDGAATSMMKLAASYRGGHSQGVFVRAFARHRLATRPDAGEVERLREALGRIASMDFRLKAYVASAVEARDIARAALKDTAK